MRLVPAIDIQGGRCVRLRRGDFADETVFGHDPVAMAQHWVGEGARYLHVVDLDGARDGEPRNFAVVREYTGHGVGRKMHEDPQVLNYVPLKSGGSPRLERGMTLALEPMVNVGTWRTRTLSDGWTVVTADGKRCAHFEHSIAVTEDEPLILTVL